MVGYGRTRDDHSDQWQWVGNGCGDYVYHHLLPGARESHRPQKQRSDCGLALSWIWNGPTNVPYSVLYRQCQPHAAYTWNQDGATAPGSGLSYAADSQYATMWEWAAQGSPANYYDNVAAYY